MKTNHKNYIKLAFNLAKQNLGKTNLNPSVGCVVVKNNAVISSGVTSKKKLKEFFLLFMMLIKGPRKNLKENY